VARPIRGKEFRRCEFLIQRDGLLKHYGFSAQPGETIALVGQTGSGKTTTS
jgi:ABC-type multidrug transport system fused ATPase/permease subunit